MYFNLIAVLPIIIIVIFSCSVFFFICWKFCRQIPQPRHIPLEEDNKTICIVDGF
jgi:hypothetical protein